MITYSRIELPGGEELCYTTESGIYLPEGLNIYDEDRRMWILGIAWDNCEQEWNCKHAHLVTTKPILDRDPALKQAEEKYVLKYKTVDKKVCLVSMVIPGGMKVKWTCYHYDFLVHLWNGLNFFELFKLLFSLGIDHNPPCFL